VKIETFKPFLSLYLGSFGFPLYLDLFLKKSDDALKNDL